MTKDNLIFGLGGMVIGVIVGVVLVNSSNTRQVVSAPVAQQMNPSTQQTATDQGQLPEGHPPVDEAGLKAQVEQQLEILKKDPENQKATVAVANLNFDLKNYQEAITFYEKALQRDPNNINLNTDLGSAHMWLGNYDKALELYNKSLARDPKHLQSLMNLGIVRMSMGDRLGAAASWEKVLEYYPDHPEANMLRQAIAKLRAPQGT